MKVTKGSPELLRLFIVLYGDISLGWPGESIPYPPCEFGDYVLRRN